jgi:succinate dehydrogenase flavin-adding protein (antitoxin of CptAB toxin-antitoxin module)
MDTNPNKIKITPKTKPQIIRNEKGQIIKGVAQDTNKNGTAGAPCKYCKDKDKYQKIADDYMLMIKNSDKPAIPWIEELALIMDIDDETLTNWANKKDENSVFEHPELYAIFRKLKTTQKFRLKQRALGRFNPHGALYLLNADHKVIQTNKNVIAGDEKEPLEIIITEEKPIPNE